jgi:hypothetical protein
MTLFNLSRKSTRIRLSPLAFVLLWGCQTEPEGLVCAQIDLQPRDTQIAGDGRDTTVVEVAVCHCGSETTCADSDLIDGISVELKADAGTLAKEVLYLESGKGTVNWTAPKLVCIDCGETAPTEGDTAQIAVQTVHDEVKGTISAMALDFTTTTWVRFDSAHRFPSDFTLSTDSEEITADGKTVTEVQLTASDLADGTMVSLSTTVGSVVPAQQPLRDETARFLFDPGTVTEEGIALLVGQIDAINYSSFPLTLRLNPDPNAAPPTFVLSSDTTEIIADGTATADIVVLAVGEDDGTVVSVTASVGEIFPTTQVIVNETAVFLYNPGAVTEETTAVLLGQIGTENQSSNPLTMSLLPDPANLSISPALANIVSNSTTTLVATGGIGTLKWASPAADHLTCNAASGLDNCEGSAKATIALETDPCETESSEEESTGTDTGDSNGGSDTGSGSATMTSMVRCEIAIWVTDEDGHQAESVIAVY